MTGTIYTLKNPKDNSIFYIGCTSLGLDKRLNSHCYTSRSKRENSPKAKIISDLLSQGLRPIIEILETCPLPECRETEMFYMGLFKSWGFPINQKRDGYNMTYRQQLAYENNIPVHTKESIGLKVDRSLLDWITEQASKENRSINNWIETTLLNIKKEKEHANS